MESHPTIQRPYRKTFLTFFLLTIETLFCAWRLLQIPSGNKNTFLFGMTKERLLMLAGFGVLLLLCLIGWFSYRKIAETTERYQKYFRPLFAIALFFLLLNLLPNYRFHAFSAYYARMRPFFLWGLLTSTTLAFALRTPSIHSIESLARFRKPFLFFLVLLCLLTLFPELNGFGKTVESALWNKNGIPLQSIQLFFCLVAYLLFMPIFTKFTPGHEKRALHFFVIWALSALIWSLAPFRAHFFAPGPYDPNYAYYPYSDAIAYDIQGISAMNGWGFNFGGTVLKPVVSFFVFLCRSLAGNNYNRSLLIQSALYAILPAIIYLFGSAIGGSKCGFLAATFSILKEWNALNSATVLTVHSRLIMSEFIMQIVLAAFCYLVFRWMQRRGYETVYAAAAGGLLSLGIFTRYNFLAFLPATLVIVCFAYHKDFRRYLLSAGIFLLAMGCTIFPWIQRSKANTNMYFPEISDTFNTVLIGRRYQPVTEESTIEKESMVTEETAAPVSFRLNIHPLVNSILNHSVHNLISSFLTLPMQLTFDDLEHLYENDAKKLWGDEWTGNFTNAQWIGVITHLALLALALAFLWNTQRFAGLSIPYFWVVYAFSVGISRSSGGRYVVPVNWCPMLLLALSLTLLINKGEVITDQPEEVHKPCLKTFCAIAVCMSFFAAMILVEKTVPQRQLNTVEDPVNFFEEQLTEEDINWDTVREQYANRTLSIDHGLAYFPRFYYYRVGEHSPWGSFAWKEYSRLVFYGINKDQNGSLNKEYLMPHTELINYFPNGSEFYAVSCRNEKLYDDVLALSAIMPDGSIQTFLRDPMREFSCPIPEPVCDGIENCK